MRIVALLILALLSTAATANEIGRIYNKGGGAIVLTTRMCENGSYRLYAYDQQGNANTGCWKVVNKEIFVRWDDGEYRIYNRDNIEFSKEFLEAVRRGEKM